MTPLPLGMARAAHPKPPSPFPWLDAALALGLFAVAALVANGCGPKAKPTAVGTANLALPVLLRAYRDEGTACVENAVTREQGVECFARVDVRWAPVWAAWRTTRMALDMSPESDVRPAVCDLAKAAVPVVPSLAETFAKVCP